MEIEDLLVDRGSTRDILPLNTFRQMGISNDLMKEGNGYLRGITGHDTLILGINKLPMTLGYWPHCARHMVEFVVAHVSTGHNGVIGRPSQAAFGAAVSIRHRMMKFITQAGVSEVHSG